MCTPRPRIRRRLRPCLPFYLLPYYSIIRKGPWRKLFNPASWRLSSQSLFQTLRMFFRSRLHCPPHNELTLKVLHVHALSPPMTLSFPIRWEVCAKLRKHHARTARSPPRLHPYPGRNLHPQSALPQPSEKVHRQSEQQERPLRHEWSLKHISPRLLSHATSQRASYRHLQLPQHLQNHLCFIPCRTTYHLSTSPRRTLLS